MNSSIVRFTETLVIDERDVSSVQELHRNNTIDIVKKGIPDSDFWCTEINVKGHYYNVPQKMEEVLRMIHWQ